MTNGVEAQHAVLHILVVGTEAWAIDRAERALQHAGHEVVRCPAAGRPGQECGVLDGTACDLDHRLDVVLSVRAHPLAHVVRSEYGAVCALRRGVPLVLAGSGASSPFACLASAVLDLDGDVVGACVQAAASTRVEPAKATLDELELLVRGGLQTLDAPRRQDLAHPVPMRRDHVTR